MFLNESLVMDRSTDNYLEGVSPLLEACLESEMTWGNIMQESMEREFAVMNMYREDTILMEEEMEKEDKNTLQKIIQWIKDRIKQVTEAFKKIARAIQDQCNKVYAMYLDKFKKIKESDLAPTAKASIRNWKDPSFSRITLCAKAHIDTTIRFVKEDYAAGDKVRERLSTMTKAYKILINDEVVEDTIESREVKVSDYIKNIKGCKEGLKNLTNKDYKEEIAYLKKFEKDMKLKENIKKVAIYKMAATTISHINAITQSTGVKLLSDSVKVLKAAKKKGSNNE